MRVKGLWLFAGLAVAGAVGLAGTLRAQEGADAEPRVRVFAFSQGSYLGVYISDVTESDVDRLGLAEERGVLITGVADEGPAREAGLEADDVILEWNGDRLESEVQLRRILAETPPGRSADLVVFRDGSTRSITVELDRRGGLGRTLSLRSGWDDEAASKLKEQMERYRGKLDDMEVRVQGMPHVFMAMRGGRLGVGIQSLGDQLGEYFGLEDRTGVLVTSVREESPAAAGGLKAGDVILAVDGEEVEGPGDVSRLVWGAEAGPVAIRILRDRGERTLTVDLPEAESHWQPAEGEMNGFFFRQPFEFDFEPGDVEVKWVEPLKELQRIEVLEVPSTGIDVTPALVRPIPRLRVLSI